MGEPTTNETTVDIQTEPIAQNGDIILAIGKPVNTKLLVSADVMARQSTVFAALLSPRFLEGQAARTSENPSKIDLPEDDCEAMRDMCNLLHGNAIQEFERPKPTTSPRILGLAIVVDKYACAARLHLQMKSLLLAWCNSNTRPPLSGSARIAAAAYLLNQPRSFLQATRRMARATSLPLSNVLQETAGSILPARVILAVEQKRTAAYAKIITKLPLEGMPQCTTCSTSEYGTSSANYDSQYMNTLCGAFNVSFWPPDFPDIECSVQEAIDKIKLIGIASRAAPSCEHTQKKKEVTAVELKRFCEDVASACDGLCLFCVKEGKVDLLSACTDEKHD